MKNKFLIFSLHFCMAGFSILNAQDCVNYATDTIPYDFNCKPTSNQFYISGEWLYWQAHQGGLEVGYFTQPALVPNTSYTVTGDGVRLKDRWTSGFRVNAGFQTACNNWDITCSYTYLPSHSYLAQTNQLSDSAPQYFYRWQSIDLIKLIGGDNANYVDGKWNLAFSYADLDIAHTFYMNSSLGIKPHIGVRGLWSNQKYEINIQRLYSITPPDTIPTSIGSILLKERLNGYGVEGGLWMNWEAFKGFSFIGHFGGAMLYSHAKVNESTDTVITSNTVPVTITPQTLELTDRVWQANPMMDFFLGIEYTSSFSQFSMNLYAGWEQHVIFDTNNWVIGSGNLNLQGLTLGVGVSF